MSINAIAPVIYDCVKIPGEADSALKIAPPKHRALDKIPGIDSRGKYFKSPSYESASSQSDRSLDEKRLLLNSRSSSWFSKTRAAVLMG